MGSMSPVQITGFQRRAHSSGDMNDPDPASIVADWIEEAERSGDELAEDPGDELAEHSGDELASPSYASIPGEELVADEVYEGGQAYSEDPAIDATVPAQIHSDWSYGPEDFSFLVDEMFDYDDVA
jgi:hypothetical protein